MALLDNVNKVIYWDEVNWQWLPFIVFRGSKIRIQLPQQRNKYIDVNSKEDSLKFLEGEGYSFSSLNRLGIVEISKGYYLYNGRVYPKEGTPTRSLTNLLTLVSEKSYNYIHTRLKGKGVISKSLVDELVSSTSIKFRGKVYKTYSDLAKDYGFSLSYLSSKLSKGISLEEAVNSYKGHEEFGVDHLGNKFSSVEEMIKHWGISRRAYNKRRDKGWSLERILTTPIKENQTAKECVDFKGNIFPSMKSMAKEYEVSHSSILYHIRKGKTPAEALKYLLTEGRVKRKVIDHKGNPFSSNTEMAKYYNVNFDTFRDRIKRGWTLEEALTSKRKER